MHELALAEAVLSAARETAEREGFKRVTKLVVSLGELQQISIPSFEFCLKEVRPSAGPLVTEAEIVLQTEPAELSCRPCARTFSLADARAPEGDNAEAVHFIPELVHAFVSCPSCGSVDFAVLRGRGVSISSIEGEDDSDA